MFICVCVYAFPYFIDEKAEKQGKDINVLKVTQQGNNGARV